MRARFLRQCAVGALGVAAAVLGSTEPAAACSCGGQPTPQQASSSADVVFEGTVLGEPEPVRAELGIQGYTGAVRFRFAVARYFKGQQGEEAAIYTVDQGSACGRSYSPGTTYVVYGRLRGDGVLTDSLCSRTRALANAAEDLAVLGAGELPDPSVQPRDVLAEAEQAEQEVGCSVAPASSVPGAAGQASRVGLGGALAFALALVRRRSSRR